MSKWEEGVMRRSRTGLTVWIQSCNNKYIIIVGKTGEDKLETLKADETSDDRSTAGEGQQGWTLQEPQHRGGWKMSLLKKARGISDSVDGSVGENGTPGNVAEDAADETDWE